MPSRNSRAVTLWGHDVYQLPLLGSNQDSPDPESRQRPPPAGKNAPKAVGIGPNPARSTHENTHDLPPSAWDDHDIAHWPLDEFLAEQARRRAEWQKANDQRRQEQARQQRERLAPGRPRLSKCPRCGGSNLNDSRRGMRCNDCRPPKKRQRSAQPRRSSWLRQYGITPAEYDAMFAAQAGLCAICKNHQTARRLAVDHCHTTGKVRGLLCTRCNSGIGQFKEDPGLFARALFYLEQHKQAGAA